MTEELTLIIEKWHHGDSCARDSLYQFAYFQLRQLARKERDKMAKKHGDNNLIIDEEIYNTTSLIHEAYLKLETTDASYITNRRQFYLMAGKIIRQIMFEAARKKSAQKRQAITEDSPLAINDEMIQNNIFFNALEHFTEKYNRQAEVIQLKYFMGMNNGDIAQIMQCSQSLVEKDTKFANSWIKSKLA